MASAKLAAWPYVLPRVEVVEAGPVTLEVAHTDGTRRGRSAWLTLE